MTYPWGVDVFPDEKEDFVNVSIKIERRDTNEDSCIPDFYYNAGKPHTETPPKRLKFL